jgi:hypothetical protein
LAKDPKTGAPKIKKEFQDAAKALGASLDEVLGGMPGKIKDFVTNPLGAALTTSTAILYDFNKQVDKIGDSFGAIGVRDFNKELLEARSEVSKLGYGLDEVTSISTQLANEFGYSFDEAIALTGTVTEMAKSLGMSTEQAGKLLGTLTKVGGLTAQQAEDLAKSTELLAKAEGVAPGQVMEDIAENTEMFAKFGKDGGKNIARAAIQAKKLGTSLDKVAGIMEGMLDFQSSLEAEMNASIILGRELNFQKARELALNNDIEGAMKEIVSQVGSEAEFNAMNAIERKALADSIGVSVDEMAKFVSNQDKATTLAGELSKQKGFDELLGKDAIGDITQLTNQLKSLGAAFTKVLGPALNMIIKPISGLVNLMGEYSTTTKVVATIIGAILVPTMIKYAAAQVEAIRNTISENVAMVKKNWSQAIKIIQDKKDLMGTMLKNRAEKIGLGLKKMWGLITSGNLALAIQAFVVDKAATAYRIAVGIPSWIAQNAAIGANHIKNMAMTAWQMGPGLAGWIATNAQLVASTVGFYALAIGQGIYSIATWAATAASTAFGISLNAALFGIPALIALIIGGVILLWKNFDKVKSFMQKMEPVIKAALTIMFFPIILAYKAFKAMAGFLGFGGGGNGGDDGATAGGEGEAPSLAKGGNVKKTGMAEVHEGEAFSGTNGQAFGPMADSIASLKTEIQGLRSDMKSYMGTGGSLARQVGSKTAEGIAGSLSKA